MSERFPNGEGLDDETTVIDAAQELAERIGAAEVLPALWQTLTDMATTDPSGGYPYSYPELEAVLAPMADATVLDAHRADIHELASLLELAAAHVDQDDIYADLEWAGAAAYVLLDALADDATDCDAHLDLAALVSLGQLPEAQSVDRVFAAAVDACPDDPTPRWLWGHHQIEWSAGTPLMEVGLTPEEALARPIAMFRDWQAEEPGSALAWAGEAEARVKQAEVMHGYGSMPFTAQADAHRALELFQSADELEHDPAFVMGQARALAVLGDWPAAADRAARAVAEAPDNPDFHSFYLQTLERAGRFAEAAASARIEDTSVTDGTRLIPEGAAYLGLVPRGAFPTQVRDLSWEDMGGGSVDWLGYIPDWRADGVLWGVDRSYWCRGEAVLRDEMLAGHAQAALESEVTDVESCDDPSRGRPALVEGSGLLRNTGGNAAFYRAWATEQLTGAVPVSVALPGGTVMGIDDYHDNVQNLWRYAGDLDLAATAAEDWLAAVPGSPRALQRVGEVRFLQGRYDDAADAFRRAVELPAGIDDDTTDPEWSGSDRAAANLDLGTALERAGHVEEAEAAYEDAINEPDVMADVDGRYQSTLAFAHARRGALLLNAGRTNDAVGDLRTADAMIREVEEFGRQEPVWDPLTESQTSGADANNLAVALLDLGEDSAEAVSTARRALAHDPESPIYLDTLAQAAQLDDQPERAVRAYRRALVADPTVYQSWTNLGVLLAEEGDHDGAVHAFRQSVTVRPDYALGWWNLGVEVGRGFGPRDLIASQRALATAVRLDRDLRGAGLELQPDTSALATGLDVSRAVPAGWSFASAARAATPGLSWMILLVALLRLGLALGLDRAGETVGLLIFDAERRRTASSPRAWIAALARVWAVLNRFTTLGWGIVAGLLVVSWPVVRSSDGHWIGVALTASALASTLWLSLAVGRTQARRAGVVVDHRGWAPGMAFGGVSALVGYAFVPVPVNNDQTAPGWVRWSGPALMSVLAGVALAVGAVTGGPEVRLVGVGVLAMVSTALFPLKPYDGGFIRSRRTEIGTALALALTSGALVLGWL